MWHHSREAPGGNQTKGWINITGDAWELMQSDVVPGNPSQINHNYKEAEKSIHLDYPQLRRATTYVNEIIEEEIANGIPPEKIFIAGYSQGGLLTLATTLTSPYKLGGVISLCGLLPCQEKLFATTKDKNKTTPCLIINNSGDPWIPLWTGEKSHEILRNRGYNAEFKSHPGLGHYWKDKDITEFLEKILTKESKNPPKQPQTKINEGWSMELKIIYSNNYWSNINNICFNNY